MIKIRFAGAGDYAAMLKIYTPYVEETSWSFETEVPQPEVFRQRMEAAGEKLPVLVAEENGEVFGFAYAHPFHERAAFDWTAESSVYVRQDARGEGVGAMLYRALLGLLEAQGVRAVCAVITLPNDASVAFHIGQGFSLGGVLPFVGFKLKEWHSVACYYRHLGAEDGAPGAVLPCGTLEDALTAEILREAVENS